MLSIELQKHDPQVKPELEITDYHTEFSGITQGALASVRTNMTTLVIIYFIQINSLYLVFNLNNIFNYMWISICFCTHTGDHNDI